jgi:hypothetical protein
MSSDTDPLGGVLGQERLRAASTVVLGVAALVLLAVLVSLLPAAVGTDTTLFGLLGVLALGLFGYVGWGVATLARTDAGQLRDEASETGSLVQWSAVLTVLLVVYSGLGPVVTPSLGDAAIVYDVVFLLVAVVPVVAIATCLRRSRSGKNSFAEKIARIREDLNPDSSTDTDDDD